MLKRIRALLGKRKKPTSQAPKTNGAGATAAAERPPVHQGPNLVHRPIPSSDLDPDAVKIVRRLARFDHRAYLVGGCVRDLLLDRRPKDFDIGTSATPRQMKRLFRNCRIIGRRFRLAHIYFQNGKIIEVATFRARDINDSIEEIPEDVLIREDNVFGTPEEDALRRDFTINALFYDVNEGNVIDHAAGLTDLRLKLVRTIGDAEIRFREDPVRILRAIKFAARLEFTIETDTRTALRHHRNELRKSASPRILEEINRFGREGAARRSFELLRETQVLEVILPEVATECARRAEAWELLLALLDRMDRERHGARRPIRTGETFTVLLLPMLAPRFGWTQDGHANPPRGVDPRELVDDALRSMALRLRIPRREQEYCRQLLTTLFRMVPANRARGAAKRAIRSRECLPDALWMLEVVANHLGGDFSAAHEFWSSQPETPERADDQEPSEDRPRRRRRRRSSSGRGRSPGGSEAPVAATPERTDEGEDKRAMPSPWDDDYFFAALPTAPEESGGAQAPQPIGEPGSEGQERKRRALTDRRETPSEPDEETGAEAKPAEGPEATAAAPRRRRRRRRRRKRATTDDASAEASSQEGAEPDPKDQPGEPSDDESGP